MVFAKRVEMDQSWKSDWRYHTTAPWIGVSLYFRGESDVSPPGKMSGMQKGIHAAEFFTAGEGRMPKMQYALHLASGGQGQEIQEKAAWLERF